MTIDPARRRILWIEVGVVLLLYFLPVFWTGLSDYLSPRAMPGFRPLATDISQIVGLLSAVIPCLYIAWGSGDGLPRFGIRAYPWWKALPLTLAAILVGLVLNRMIGVGLRNLTPEFYARSQHVLMLNIQRPHRTWSSMSFRSCEFAIGAFAEEFVMRGYLITRLTELLGKSWVALVISSMLFASYHIYEGPAAVISIVVFGFTYGVVFMISRSVWPGTIGHALTNMIWTFL